MASQGNTLVIHVVCARDLHIRGHRPVDVYVSLATSGKGPWKSKVTTNPIRVDPSENSQQQREQRWDEHCEFQLNDTDSKLVIHVNHKTLLGTTETLGELVFPLEGMARFQPAAWFRLGTKSGEQRGQMQLGYQFSNRMASSISNMSLNKIEKEKKFDRLRRKMQQLGRSKKAQPANASGDDNGSLASVSLAGIGGAAYGHSRRSSASSAASGALAFSTPSPNTMLQLEEQQQQRREEQHQMGNNQQQRHHQHKMAPSNGREDTMSMHSMVVSNSRSETPHNQTPMKASFADVVQSAARSARWGVAATTRQHEDVLPLNNTNNNNSSASAAGEHATAGAASGAASLRAPMDPLMPPAGGECAADRISIGTASIASSTTAARGMPPSANGAPCEPIPPTPQQRNLKTIMRQKAEQLFQLRNGGSGSGKRHGQNQPQVTIDDFDSATLHRSRRGSIASSSGFASLGSGQLGALNEHTSPEHLLNVIIHLRRELLKKEERIRDLENYTDNLVNKVMVSNPELLCQPSPSPSSSKRSTTSFFRR